MAMGLIWAFVAIDWTSGTEISLQYIKPFGQIFLSLLQMMAVPLIISSLITGIANITDISTLTRIGGKTISLFILTGLIATILGLFLSNVIQPGDQITPEIKQELLAKFSEGAEATVKKKEATQGGPLDPLVNAFPRNIFQASSDNSAMLQIVVFSLLFGIALSGTGREKTGTVTAFFSGTNEVLIKLVTLVMKFAPLGVFALVASVVIESSGNDPSGAGQLLLTLLWYCLTVLVGLLIILFGFYPVLLITFSKVRIKDFYKSMRPAFLLAFSSSSSTATLPVTMERVEKHLHIPEHISRFVLPLGTTINMDGTALYQSIAAIFIAQTFGIDLSIWQQAGIVLTATLAAIGAAGIPGAGMITLVIVLQGAGVPLEGIALIMAPDRLLDMCRTVINVAGDATAAAVISGTETSLNKNEL